MSLLFKVATWVQTTHWADLVMIIKCHSNQNSLSLSLWSLPLFGSINGHHVAAKWSLLQSRHAHGHVYIRVLSFNQWDRFLRLYWPIVSHQVTLSVPAQVFKGPWRWVIVIQKFCLGNLSLLSQSPRFYFSLTMVSVPRVIWIIIINLNWLPHNLISDNR